MPLSQQHITPKTPMGANLIEDGATFRMWAPCADLCGNFHNSDNWMPNEANELIKDSKGYRSGFLPRVKDGDQYKFFAYGKSSKLDAYVRELTAQDPPSPWSNSIFRNPHNYPWHDQNYRPSPFHDLIIFQLHTGPFTVL